MHVPGQIRERKSNDHEGCVRGKQWPTRHQQQQQPVPTPDIARTPRIVRPDSFQQQNGDFLQDRAGARG
jgi:hypothetical protein